jgi:Glyoxalase-like domain
MAVDATDSGGGPRMLFHPVSEPETAKNRLRPVLLTETYDEETGRLTGLGARPLNETKLPAVCWTTFAGPEGNEFDLVTWQPQ